MGVKRNIVAAYRQRQGESPLKNIIITGIIPLWLLIGAATATADVVKPALIEITADVSGKATIELRVSIEALLTGINARYKNTKEAPTAAEYDALRVLESDPLRRKFRPFEVEFLRAIEFTADGKPVDLRFAKVDIPPPGYTKVPRISLIILEAPLDRSTGRLQFYYPARFGDSAVRVRQVDRQAGRYHWSEWQWVRTDKPSREFSLTNLFTRTPVSSVIASYISIGFTHILPKGLDHILFILGLFLFSTRLRPLLGQVTMFTLAHTLTLGLSMAGIFSLPARIVEPLIALSIAYVGIENLLHRSLSNSRLLLVFAFGLLHGLGFAGVLADFGMPADAFLTALVSFNIGVELGQLAILLGGFMLLSYWFGHKVWYRSWVVVPGSLAIAAIGLYWTIDRLEWI